MKINKILSIAGFCLLATALVVIGKTPSATGYEPSIYAAYPVYLWVLLICSLTCGINILVHHVFFTKNSRCYVTGLVLVIFANFVFLLLPYFHGYAFYGRGDALTHVGYVKDIFLTGHTGYSNIYPIIHMLIAELTNITGLSIESIFFLLLALLPCFYLVSIYLLAKVIANNHFQALLVTAFATPLIFSYLQSNLEPSMLSLFILPLLVYLYHRTSHSETNRPQYTALLLLFAIFITFFHPVTTLLAIVALLIFAVAPFIYKWYMRNKAISLILEKIEYNSKIALVTCLVMVIFFGSWYISVGTINSQFVKMQDWILYEIFGSSDSTSYNLDIATEPQPSLFEKRLHTVSSAKISWSLALEVFINRYGAIFLYLIISLILSILVLVDLISKRNSNPVYFIFSLQFLIALFISAFLLFGYSLGDEIRIVRATLFMGTILCGLVLYNKLGYKDKKVNENYIFTQKLVSTAAVSIIIISAAILSMGSVYSSPRTCVANHQVTEKDIDGSKWLGINGNKDIPVVTSFFRAIQRFEHYNFGKDFPTTVNAIRGERLPRHFGYDEFNEIGVAINYDSAYVVLFQRDKMSPLFYPESVRSRVHVFTEDDYSKLNSDPTTGKLYTNSEFEVWEVHR